MRYCGGDFANLQTPNTLVLPNSPPAYPVKARVSSAFLDHCDLRLANRLAARESPTIQPPLPLVIQKAMKTLKRCSVIFRSFTAFHIGMSRTLRLQNASLLVGCIRLFVCLLFLESGSGLELQAQEASQQSAENQSVVENSATENAPQVSGPADGSQNSTLGSESSEPEAVAPAVSEEQQLIDAILKSTPADEPTLPATDASAGSVSDSVSFAFDRTPWRDVINWIADEAGLALHVGELPTGSFSYSDSSRFEIQEAIDRINLFLQPEGYTILRSGKMLSVVNLGDPRSKQQLNALARMVDPDTLGDLPNHDVVRCLFPLGEIDAEGAVAEVEVLNLMVTPEVLSRTNQLLMIDTVSKLRSVKKILDAFQTDEMENGTVVQSFALRHVEAEDVLEVARPHLGLAPGEMIGIDVSVSADIRGQHLYVTGMEDKVKLLEGLIQSIDQPEVSEGDSMVPSELRRHLVEGGNVDTVYNVLQTLLAGRDVRLSIDTASSSIVAWAPPSVQDEIQQTVMQLQAAEADFEVIPLRTADPFFVISLLEEMLDLPSAFEDPDEIDPNTPKIDADPANRRLFVRAKRPQLEQIKKIVEGLDGVQGPAGAAEVSESPMRSSVDQTRVLPMRGESALNIIEAATKFWRGKNPVVVYRPLVGEERASERVLAESGVDRMNRFGPQGSRPMGRADLPAMIRGLGSREALQRRQSVISSQRWLTANGESEAPEIKCQLLPEGLLMQCEDIAALDEFESHIQLIASSFGASVSPPVVFYLKYAKADDALRMLADLIEGGEVASDATESSLVNGYVPSASYYGAFLTSREGMLTLSAGKTMTVTSDSRLNRLIAQGTLDEIDTVEGYLKIVDKDNSITAVETNGTSHLIELKHAQAEEVAETLRSAFAGRVVIDQSRQEKQPAASGTQAQPRASDSRDDRDKKSDSKSSNSKGGQAIIDRIPKMTIAVHEASNSLVVTAPQQLFVEVERLAKVIDSMAEETVEVIAPQSGAVFESVLMRYLGREVPGRSYGSPGKQPERREPTGKRVDDGK